MTKLYLVIHKRSLKNHKNDKSQINKYEILIKSNKFNIDLNIKLWIKFVYRLEMENITGVMDIGLNFKK